ncbi:MAG: hypothetical protein ACRDQ5_14040 [Sciscionella sp.]
MTADLAVAAVLGYLLPAFSVVALMVALINRVRATRNTTPDAEKTARPHEAASVLTRTVITRWRLA